MADVLTLTEIGRLVSYIAPGYFARWTYRKRFPKGLEQPGEILIQSVVLSLPFVALAHEIAGARTSLSWIYLIALLGPAVAAGAVTAWLRDLDTTRNFALALGVSAQPDASMWVRTIGRLPKDALIVIDLKDGSRIAGVPRSMPGLPDDNVKELYLIDPRYEDSTGALVSVDRAASVIVRIDEISMVTLSQEPTLLAG